MSAQARAKRERIRFAAADRFAEGLAPPQVAHWLRVTRKSACEWHRAWKDGGKQALASKGPGGSACQLSDEQITVLEAALDAGPGAHGWSDDQRWTLARITCVIQEHSASPTPRAALPTCCIGSAGRPSGPSAGPPNATRRPSPPG
ncbi:transposase [Sphaerimonospora cavernae]|uniref:Transposase n=1 Tax=Sphaerimonospora cavernae TaxID=1740611 RepID=A0ABV6U677_9ACTN